MRFVPFAMENAFVCQIEILSLDEQVADGFMFSEQPFVHATVDN